MPWPEMLDLKKKINRTQGLGGRWVVSVLLAYETPPIFSQVVLHL